MPPPTPKTRTAVQSDREDSRSSSRPPERGLPPLQIRYFKRMKKQRVYDFEVTWDQEFTYRGPDQSVVVRLLAGGAQVVPSEVQLDPKDPKDKARFAVTPLAKGWLSGQKLEVVVNGKKVQEIHLHSRVVSQRMPWACFLLIFLAPWFLLNFVKGKGNAPDSQATPKINSVIAKNLPDTPDFVPEDIKTGLVEFRGSFAEVLKDIHLFAWEYHLAFYSAILFTLLWLISLWTHRDTRKRLIGKPLFLPRAEKPEGEA